LNKLITAVSNFSSLPIVSSSVIEVEGLPKNIFPALFPKNRAHDIQHH
jgi:hypothetical protein